MKKRKPKAKKQAINHEIFLGKQMLHSGRLCTVGFIDGDHAFISYNGHAEARTVHIDDLYPPRES